MIRGTVHGLEARVELEVSGPSTQSQTITAAIDTGYNGYLTLPNSVVNALGLPTAGHRTGMLADGSVVILEMYLAKVVWQGQQRDILVAQSTGSPLAGMALLQGNRLTIDVKDGGDATIEVLP